ncbi:hypothetical protein LINPERPRIM_LOCUS2019 [Linum perenne]
MTDIRGGAEEERLLLLTMLEDSAAELISQGPPALVWRFTPKGQFSFSLAGVSQENFYF